ncbi:hypothetical protein OQJ59_13130 [Microbulbifer thermotolerans]|uniref:Uncharacterized protein n=1 Tax=Microbulbifer thermotolerans TaxID=252514 RepID=A0AB35HVR2_MICTH|nr:hypothetical protein [Microbulbifer thermotolerans]MCX2801310.1 hypothetical protein [Microbulbifer thermotolerans]MCX2842563.1 hypothetical protein [Microbulbifer thermotolerans]
MQNKGEAWILISGGNGVGRNVYVHKPQEKAWKTIQSEHNGNYYLTCVLRAVHALNSVAVGRRFQTEKLEFDGAAIHYQLDIDGDVLIYGLEIKSDYKHISGPQTTGLYQVEWQERIEKWRTSNQLRTKMKLDHRWNEAHYAAVSGKFDNKEDAGELLIEHIHGAYNTLKTQKTNRSGNHYSLYWQNGGFKSDKHRDHLASLIQQAMLAGAEVNWLAHGEGAGTFVRAMQVLERRLSPVPVSQNSEEAATLRENLQLQSVYFSNPRGAGTREQELKALCKKVGIEYKGTKINPYDLFNPDTRKDVLRKTKLTLSTIAIGGGGAVLGTSDIENVLTQAISAKSIGIAAGFAIAGYFVISDKIKTNSGYVRALPRTISSTFGKGNQRWAA